MPGTPGFTGVSIDNHTGGRLVARRLVERVCKAYFTDGVYRWRTEGFLAELQAAGVAGKVSLDLGAGAGAAEQNPPGGEHPIGAFDAARFARAVEEYRAGGGEWPIGIFATTDVVACAVLRLLRDLALTPGREALLIGYDDQFLTGHLLPALTTVHQPFRDEGRLAARKMIRLIYGGEEVSESVAPYLVIRETA